MKYPEAGKHWFAVIARPQAMKQTSPRLVSNLTAVGKTPEDAWCSNVDDRAP